MADKKSQYQVVVVFNPKTEEKQKETVFKQIEKWVEGNQARVVKKESLGQKQLAYEIKGCSSGDYWTVDVESDKPLKLRDFSIYLNREVCVIRYLVLKK